MAGGLREFLKTKGGRTVGVIGACVALLIAAYAVWSALGPSDIQDATNARYFVDISTQPPKAFKASLEPGVKIPIKGPSGKETAYPAELCYWTKEGGIKKDPTYVVTNVMIGKEGPTFCPDCGRLVVAHNPPPVAGMKPPPTKQEYESRRGNRRPADDRDTH
jgi:hypothetical protein